MPALLEHFPMPPAIFAVGLAVLACLGLALAAPWKYLQTPDCVQPADVVTPGSSETLDCTTSQWTVTNWHDTITYTGDASGYTAGEPVRTDDADTFRAATVEECPAVVVVNTSGPLAATPASLAQTGANPVGLVAGAALAFLFGAVFLLTSVIRKRKSI